MSNIRSSHSVGAAPCGGPRADKIRTNCVQSLWSLVGRDDPARRMSVPISVHVPLIRPSVRAGAPSPWGRLDGRPQAAPTVIPPTNDTLCRGRCPHRPASPPCQKGEEHKVAGGFIRKGKCDGIPQSRPRKLHIIRFRRNGESSLIPLLVLSPTKPAALPGAPYFL